MYLFVCVCVYIRMQPACMSEGCYVKSSKVYLNSMIRNLM